MTFNRFAGLGTCTLSERSFFARAPLGRDVSRAGNGMSAIRVLRFASALEQRRAPSRGVNARPTWVSPTLHGMDEVAAAREEVRAKIRSRAPPKLAKRPAQVIVQVVARTIPKVAGAGWVPSDEQ